MESTNSFIKKPGDIVVNSPLRVPISKRKDFILNLNNYRNTHFRVLVKAKKVYTFYMINGPLVGLSNMIHAEIFYRLYPKTKRKTDIGNVISIHQKFFEDAMVAAHLIPDDDYKHVIRSTQLPVLMIDRVNPRVEITVRPIKTKDIKGVINESKG